MTSSTLASVMSRQRSCSSTIRRRARELRSSSQLPVVRASPLPKSSPASGGRSASVKSRKAFDQKGIVLSPPVRFYTAAPAVTTARAKTAANGLCFRITKQETGTFAEVGYAGA